MDNILTSLRLNERAATWLSYAILCGMMVCAIIIAVRFGQALLPTWQGGYLVPLGFLVVLETFYTQRKRKNLVVLDQEWFIFYLAEFVVLLLLTKAFQLAWGGVNGLIAQITAMQQDFGNTFFDTEFLFSMLALFVIWLVSLAFSSPLEELRASEYNLRIEEDVGAYSERSAARQSLVDQVLLIGMVMVIMVSLMRSSRTAGWFSLPGTRLEVILIVVYFMLGLVLLSLTQYAVMQMRWAINRIPTSKHLASNWALFGLIFLMLIAGVSLLLPTGYTIDLLTLLNLIVAIVMAAIQLLTWLMLAMFMLVAYLLGLISGAPPEQQPLPPAPLPTPLPPAEAVETSFNFLEWIGSLLFWFVIGAMLIYLLVYFVQVRRSDMARVARLPIFSTLNALWQSLREWISRLRRQVSQTVKEGIQRIQRTPPASVPKFSWRYTSLRRMTPRQRVIFYYLALVRRGGESGTPRGQSQTPYEYAARLSDALEDEPSDGGENIRTDLDTITARFVEARYSRHAVLSEEVSLVRRSWQRLKIALRHLNRLKYSR